MRAVFYFTTRQGVILTLTTPLQTALAPLTAAAPTASRKRIFLFEVYAADYLPPAGVFDPTDAIALWAKLTITWLGHDYAPRVMSHSSFSQHITKQFNSGTITLDNTQRYFANFIETHTIDGMRLVVRYINTDLSATLADSVVRFVGRLETPDGSDVDREQGELTAKEELASLDIEVPRQRISAEDPDGRSPNDPLYEGVLFNAHPSLVKSSEQVPTSHLFGLIRGSKTVVKYLQWSSVTTAVTDQIIPLVLGRVQSEGLAAFWDDIGFYIIGIFLYAAHKVTSITNFFLPDPNYIFYGWWSSETNRQTHVHLGDPGGTGTNASPDTIESNYQQNTALLSRKAYVGFAIGGPESATQPFANPQQDSVPTLVAIVRGEVDLPSGGVFSAKGFSDSPVYAARLVLTSKDFFGLEASLVNDSNLPAVNAERQRPIVDKSNGEFLALMSHDASAVTDGRLVRLNSTGLIDARYFRHLLDSSYPDPLVTNRDDIYSVLPGGTNPTGGDQELVSGTGLAGQTVGSAAWKYYFIDTPVGADQLVVTATGSGDGTTFLKVGSKPSLTDFDHFTYTASPQTITVTNPTAGRWWIGIAGFQPDGTPAAGLSYSIIAIVSGGAAGAVLPVRPEVRKNYTLNIPLTDTSNASDFLWDVVYATGRLYHVIDSAGRIDIRAKKASDSAYLIQSASIGDTAIQIANVEPWRASSQGYVLINPGLTTSEYRKITGATYNATIGNAITLTVSSPGTSISASGATLSGGNSTTPSSGTVTVGSVGTVGDVLTVTVWGIPITYTVTGNDNTSSIAGMLASWINADPNLRQYVRATWNSNNTLTIYSTVGTLAFADALVSNHAAQVNSPVTAPTAGTTTLGTLTPGDYYLGYTLVDGSGDETLMSPLQKITITSGQKVSVSSLGALPSGTAGANWYFSPAVNDDHVQFLSTNAGGAFTINSLPDLDSDFPPTVNQTGGETIRIMEVFNAYNIRKDSFKWSPSQSKINQITGTFVDAANGFKRTPITVNDRAHQRAVRKINKQEINLSGVDNFSQASRLANSALSEERDGGQRFKLNTDDAGIPLEIGDVVAVTTQYVNSSGVVVKEFVNQPVTIEDIDHQEDFDVALDCRIYSSSLMEGQTGRKPVVLSSTLKYLTEQQHFAPVPTGIVVRRDGANNVQVAITPRAQTQNDTLEYAVDIVSSITAFTVDPATSIFTSVAHGLSDGDEIAVSSLGVLPKPLKQIKHYFVVNKTTDTFQVTILSGSAPVVIADAGSGVHSFARIIRRLPIASPGIFQPAILEDPATTTVTSSSWAETDTTTHSGNNITGSTGLVRRILGQFDGPGAAVEATWSANPKIAPTANAKIKLIDETNTERFSLEFVVLTSVAEYGTATTVPKFTLRFHETGQPDVADSTGELINQTRYRLQLSGTELRVYRNYAGTGTPKLVRSVAGVTFPLRVEFDTEDRHFFRNITFGGVSDFLTTYPTSDQTIDLGSVPATLRFRVFEVRHIYNVTYLGDAADFVT